MSNEFINQDIPVSEKIRMYRKKRGISLADFRRALNRGHTSMAGTTSDSKTSNFLEICTALPADPDDLLMVQHPQLEPEVFSAYEEVSSLDEEEKWLVVDLIRVIVNSSKRKKNPRQISE